jgi:hypothetical protein
MRDALRAVGHHTVAIDYSWYHRPRMPEEYVLYPLEMLVGRFRPCMIVGSRPETATAP